MEELVSRNYQKTNEILWGLESLRDLSKCLRLQGTEEGDLSYDHMLMVFETSLSSLEADIKHILDDCEVCFLDQSDPPQD